MSVISFHSEDVDFLLNNENQYIDWLMSLAQMHGREIEGLSYIFCSDKYLHKINVDFLKHDTYTDIITFPYGDSEKLESDIFISIDRVKENASQYEEPFRNELLRVISHGLLHLCGYGDKTEEDKSIMRSKEEEAISLFHNQKT